MPSTFWNHDSSDFLRIGPAYNQRHIDIIMGIWILALPIRPTYRWPVPAYTLLFQLIAVNDNKSVIPQAGVSKQVGPFNHLNDTLELTAQLLNAPTGSMISLGHRWRGSFPKLPKSAWPCCFTRRSFC